MLVKFSVEHLNGNKENISIPDNIGTIMFENGAIRAFNPFWVPAILDSIVPNSPAYNSGFLKGDRIVKVNGNDVVKWEEFTEQVKANTTQNIDIDIKRGNEIISNTVTLNDNNQIGVYVLEPGNLTPTTLKYSFVESINDGFDRAYWELLDYVGQFKYIFTEKGASQLGGFAAIGNLFPAGVELERFLGNYCTSFYYFGFYECVTYSRFRWRTCYVFDV